MKKLYLIQDAKTAGDMFTEYADTKEAADRKAAATVNHLTEKEKATRWIFVEVYEVPDDFDPTTADPSVYDDYLGNDDHYLSGYEVFKGDKYHD